MKKMKIENLVYMITIFAAVTVMMACDPEDPKTDGRSPDDYDRKTMLNNLSTQYILPAYKNYNTQCQRLHEWTLQFESLPNQANLDSVQKNWENALLVWQDVAFLEFGPASNIGLRGQTNLYPVDTLLIISNIFDGDYNLELAKNYDAKGFQAIDYLIHGIKPNEDLILSYFESNDKARAYLKDVANEIKTNANTVYNSWNNDYQTTFINNSGSNAEGSAVSDVINSLVLHYETYVRKGKIGLPAGVFNGFSGLALPGHVEALYYEQSLPFVLRSLQSIDKFIHGESYDNAENGDGLTDYLAFVEVTFTNQALEDVINNQIDTIISSIGAIDDPLSNEVEENKTGVLAVYEQMQKLVAFLKVEMTNSLDVLITYQDTDGD